MNNKNGMLITKYNPKIFNKKIPPKKNSKNAILY